MSLKRSHVLLVAPLTLALAVCGRTAEPPAPGTSMGTPPDLRGQRVLVLPVQLVSGIQGSVDAELAFGLRDRGAQVEWILPNRLEEALQYAPGVQARSRGLPVSQFLSAEVRRVGDPLYGQLRRLAALVDAEVVLIPVRAGLEPHAEGGSAVRFHAALVAVRTGRVLWFGIEEGDAHPPGDPRALATAVDALARTLLWYASR